MKCLESFLLISHEARFDSSVCSERGCQQNPCYRHGGCLAGDIWANNAEIRIQTYGLSVVVWSISSGMMRPLHSHYLQFIWVILFGHFLVSKKLILSLMTCDDSSVFPTVLRVTTSWPSSRWKPSGRRGNRWTCEYHSSVSSTPYCRGKRADTSLGLRSLRHHKHKYKFSCCALSQTPWKVVYRFIGSTVCDRRTFVCCFDCRVLAVLTFFCPECENLLRLHRLSVIWRWINRT